MKRVLMLLSLAGSSLVLHALGGGGGTTQQQAGGTLTQLSTTIASNSITVGTSFVPSDPANRSAMVLGTEFSKALVDTLNSISNQTITGTDTASAALNGNSGKVTSQNLLSITSGLPPGGVVGHKYDYRCLQIPPCDTFAAGFPLSATGGVQPFSWTVSGLPPGLKLITSNSTGSGCLSVSLPAVCGTPTAAGSYNVTVKVTDSESPAEIASATYPVSIKEATTNPIAFLDQPLTPDATAPDGAGFTLRVRGTGFVPGSVVHWNGSARASTFVNESELNASILAADIITANTASVTVVNPSPGGGTSNGLFFQTAKPSPWVALASPKQETVSTGPFSFTLGDFNGDKKLDLAIVNNNFNNGSVYLGNGDGTFKLASNFIVGTNPSSVAVGDFNGDGKLDLAVTNNASNNVSILLGNGDGTFLAARNYEVAQNPISVVVGDFNGDGALDLAVTNYTSNDVSVLLGNADGTFQPAVNYGVGANPAALAVGDFNGDGKLDLVVTSTSSFSLSILFGIGNGAFQPAVNLNVGQTSGSVVVGDFNGDDKLDIAESNTVGNTVNVLLGKGDGTFQAPVPYGAGQEPELALADLNRDGKLDLAIADVGTGKVTVLLGNGDGTFQPTVSYLVGQGVGGIALGDFNDDGQLDFAVGGAPSAISVLLQTVPVSGPNATLSSTKMYFECRNVINAGCQCVTAGALTLSNFGSQTLSISGISITGPFSERNYCGTSLESGRSCTIGVSWMEKNGSGGGFLTINDNAPGSPQRVALSAIKECTPIANNPVSATDLVCQSVPAPKTLMENPLWGLLWDSNSLEHPDLR